MIRLLAEAAKTSWPDAIVYATLIIGVAVVLIAYKDKW